MKNLFVCFVFNLFVDREFLIRVENKMKITENFLTISLGKNNNDLLNN